MAGGHTSSHVPTMVADKADSAPSRILALDGMRGLGALGVAVGHWGVWESLYGAYVLMDVFFVLSGFLITNLLIGYGNLPPKRRLRRFCRGRAIRLLPALLVVLPTTFVLTKLAGTSNHECVPAEGALALTFVYNAPAYGLDYCGSTDPALGPLWSLSVEEQFYIVWALVMAAFLLHRQARALCLGAAVAMTVAGFVALALESGLSPALPDLPDAYARTEARALGLGGGATLALLIRGRRSMRLQLAWPLLAMAALVWVAGRGNPHVPYALISVATCTTAVWWILASLKPRPGLARRLMEARPVVLTGQISYPLYVLHFPIEEFLQANPTIDTNRGAYLPLYLVVVLTAAWLVHRYAERPVAAFSRHRRGS